MRPTTPTLPHARPMPVPATVAALWHDLMRDLFDSYRPELHYMRGPGPAWRAKHVPERAEEPAGMHAAI